MTGKRFKVVGVGLSKTGTSSLKVMLQHLGYRTCGPRKDLLFQVRRGNLSSIDPVLEDYDAFEDWPWPLTYRYVHQKYGTRAKFILTIRASFENWYASLVKHGQSSSPLKGMYLTYGYYRPDGHDRELRQIYERHNAEVRSFFASMTDQFVEFCPERGDGWNKICGLLEEPVPNLPVPRVNKSTDRRKPLNVAVNGVVTPIYRFLVSAKVKD